jgi:hypothetical protein
MPHVPCILFYAFISIVKNTLSTFCHASFVSKVTFSTFLCISVFIYKQCLHNAYFNLLVEAKTQLGFRYASISTEFFVLFFVFVSNHNSWVLASTIA